MKTFTATWLPDSGWSSALGATDGTDTAVFVFGSADLEQISAPLREIARAYPNSKIIGCSTAGQIDSDTVHDDGLVLVSCCFEASSVVAASCPVGAAAESHEAGRKLGELLAHASPELHSVFVLTDGIDVNGTTLVAGMTEALGASVSISGGMAADGPRFHQTWVIVDGEPQRGYATALGFSGASLHVGHGSQGGWDILGPERFVTRSEGNVLYELDGKPALELYKRYLGERARGLPATALLFPLAVRPNSAATHHVVRTVLGVDEADQSMIFAGDVPQGSICRLMRATVDRLIDGANEAAAEVALEADVPVLAFAVSCVGRRLVLGRRTEDELLAVRAALPADAVVAGYYSYGEIAPAQTGVSELCNQTMTITTFQEVCVP